MGLLTAWRVQAAPHPAAPPMNRTEHLHHVCAPLVIDEIKPSSSATLVPGVGAVMVQAMVSAALPLVAWNVRNRFGASFPLVVFYSKYSEASVRTMLGKDPHARLAPLPGSYFTVMGGPIPERDSLQALFTDAIFWDAIASALPPNTTHVITVHDDAWICAPDASDRLRRYLPWADYVGSPWGWTLDRDSDRFLIPESFIDKRAGPTMVQHHVKEWWERMENQETVKRAKASGDFEFMEASFRACNGVGNGGVSLRRIAAARLLSSRFGPSKSIHDLKVPALPEDLWYCALQGLLYGESPTARAAAGIAGAGRRATRAEAGAFAAEALLHINRTDDDSVGSHSSHSSSPESLASGEWPLTSHRLWTRVVPHAYRGCLQANHPQSVARGCPGLALAQAIAERTPCDPRLIRERELRLLGKVKVSPSAPKPRENASASLHPHRHNSRHASDHSEKLLFGATEEAELVQCALDTAAFADLVFVAGSSSADRDARYNLRDSPVDATSRALGTFLRERARIRGA